MILGRSGTGKSVTLRQLNGLEQPDAGRVEFARPRHRPLSETDLFPLRRRIAMLFQSGALFDSMNVFENIAFPLREHTDLERRGDRRARARDARHASGCPDRGADAVGALGRHEEARRARPLAGARARGATLRRAHHRPRPDDFGRRSRTLIAHHPPARARPPSSSPTTCALARTVGHRACLPRGGRASASSAPGRRPTRSRDALVAHFLAGGGKGAADGRAAPPSSASACW